MTSRVIRYHWSMRALHWAMAALIISMLSAGLAMVKSLDVWQVALLSLHKSTGVLAAVLVIFRFINRLSQPQPVLPIDIPNWQQKAAHGTHYALYLLMFLMPISGLLMQYFAARPVSVFTLFNIAGAPSADIKLYAVFVIVHSFLALSLIGLIALHALAALYHHFIRKDGVLKSML
ncbi:cytochrome b [Pseudoalteromonas pernae]|uniref:cytochrome b n=1 Tax=Pseudoalteromonas pernae TaxID=3118054 RepID=UPI003241E153